MKIANLIFILIKLIFCFLQPHSPDNRALARECKDVKIDRVYIGSCTGGKTEDFMAAAKVFLASVRSHPNISPFIIVSTFCFHLNVNIVMTWCEL